MKIQCDVCNKDEASVFCSADEAALCAACDHRVHHANKLAGKHQRFSLLQPSSKQFPLCDICQEKTAFLFCQQDRALLCKDCDVPIHKANEHTKNHDRFLLTGVKLSATSAIYLSSSPAATVTNNGCDVVPNFNKTPNSIDKPISVPSQITNPPSIPKVATLTSGEKGGKNTNPQMIINGGSSNGSTSSISEYLMEMLPGWHVEDFLDSISASNGFRKTCENDGLPFWDDDLEGNLNSFSSENMRIWVPQAPHPVHPPQSYPSSSMAFGGQICFKDPKEATTNIKSSRKWRDDGGFTVPQISPPLLPPRDSELFGSSINHN